MKIRLGHLYPSLLNIYGDRGNILCLQKRCRDRGIDLEVINITLNDETKRGEFDIFFGGGGQDKQQLIVAEDLQKKGDVLRAEAERGVPMLTICGTYQLFGHHFKTHEGDKIPGISIFDAVTTASHKRKIGNVVADASNLKLPKSSNGDDLLVGFENHSGNTFITKKELQKSKHKTLPLAKIEKGFGNNGKDGFEGARYQNVFGTYLHGPILPKNPHFADLLIKLALGTKHSKIVELQSLDDALEWQAHKAAIHRTYRASS